MERRRPAGSTIRMVDRSAGRRRGPPARCRRLSEPGGVSNPDTMTYRWPAHERPPRGSARRSARRRLDVGAVVPRCRSAARPRPSRSPRTRDSPGPAPREAPTGAGRPRLRRHGGSAGCGRRRPGHQAEGDEEDRHDVRRVARDQSQRRPEVRTGPTTEQQDGVGQGVDQEQQPAPDRGAGAAKRQDHEHHQDGPAESHRPGRRDNDGARLPGPPRAPDEAGDGVAGQEVADELGRRRRRARRGAVDRCERAVRHDVAAISATRGTHTTRWLPERHDDPAQADRLGERHGHEAEHHRVQHRPLLEQESRGRRQHDQRAGPAAVLLQPVQQAPGREEQEDRDREVLDGHRPPLGRRERQRAEQVDRQDRQPPPRAGQQATEDQPGERRGDQLQDHDLDHGKRPVQGREVGVGQAIRNPPGNRWPE